MAVLRGALLTVATLVVALAALLLLRATPIGLLLARREELGIARQEGLRVARAERGLFARLRGMDGFRVLAVVELFVMGGVAGERIVPGAAFRPIEVRGVLAELLVHRRDQAEIMLGMLIIVFRRHRVARGLRIAGELNVFFSDVRRRSANLDVRAVGFVNPRQRIVALAVTPPHALVLTVSHGLLVRQPLLCDGLMPPIDLVVSSDFMSNPEPPRRSFIELPTVVLRWS